MKVFARFCVFLTIVTAFSGATWKINYPETNATGSVDEEIPVSGTGPNVINAYIVQIMHEGPSPRPRMDSVAGNTNANGSWSCILDEAPWMKGFASIEVLSGGVVEDLRLIDIKASSN